MRLKRSQKFNQMTAFPSDFMIEMKKDTKAQIN